LVDCVKVFYTVGAYTFFSSLKLSAQQKMDAKGNLKHMISNLCVHEWLHHMIWFYIFSLLDMAIEMRNARANNATWKLEWNHAYIDYQAISCIYIIKDKLELHSFQINLFINYLEELMKIIWKQFVNNVISCFRKFS
jgi:hypothetical protein